MSVLTFSDIVGQEYIWVLTVKIDRPHENQSSDHRQPILNSGCLQEGTDPEWRRWKVKNASDQDLAFYLGEKEVSNTWYIHGYSSFVAKNLHLYFSITNPQGPDKVLEKHDTTYRFIQIMGEIDG